MSDCPPDVTAYGLAAAGRLLADRGWTVARTVPTQAPRTCERDGTPRVARQRVVAHRQVELVVVHAPCGRET